MNSHELQRKIRGGDRDAFRALYAACGQGVYTRAQAALGDADAARDAVKQVFLNLHNEILASGQPLDIDARLVDLLDGEVRMRRVLAGDFTAADDARPAPPPPEAPVQSAPATEAPAPEKPPRPAPDPFSEAEPYRPPLERAQAYMQADAAGARQKKQKERPSRTRGNAFITVLIVIFLLLFLWVLAGILMDFKILPRIDLGFRWFNEAIFPLFSLQS